MNGNRHCFCFDCYCSRKMEELCMCRTCLNESNSNFISIYSDVSSDDDDLLVENENNRQIAKILDELTNNKYVCGLCLFWKYFVETVIDVLFVFLVLEYE